MEEHRNPRRSRRLAYQRARLQQGLLMSVILLGTILCLTLGSLLTPDRTYSDSENRKLAQFPKLSWAAVKDGSWFSDLESYTADQFAGRDFWIALRLRFLKLTGQKESNGVYLCSGDYLMEPPADPPQDSRNVEAINAFAARHTDLRLNMAVIPNAACILADKLPKNAPVRDQSADLTALAGSLQGISFLDVSAALSAHTDEQLYYRTDHHWTSLGAYYGLTALAESMGLPCPALDSYTDRHVVSEEFYGTTWSSSGFSWVKPDSMEIFVNAPEALKVTSYPEGSPVDGKLYDFSYLEKKDKYSMFMGGNCPMHVIETGNEDKPSLLILRDSYTDSLLPLLLDDFSEIHVLDLRYYLASLKSYIEQNDFDSVLVCYSVSNFSTDSNIFLLSR